MDFNVYYSSRRTSITESSSARPDCPSITDRRLASHVVHDPVEVLSDAGVHSGYASGTAASHPERHHADDPVRGPEPVESHQGAAGVSGAGVALILPAGAHLAGSDDGPLPAEHLGALLVGHHRHAQLHQHVTRVADWGPNAAAGQQLITQ